MMHLTEKFAHLNISLDDIKLATENFAVKNCIGGGGFGTVYKGELLLSNTRFCDEGGEKILVYEYASKGSLDSYLSNNDLKWIQRLKICIGAARGLAYLHDPGVTHQRVLHRDIKSSNILLDENWNARIADLGLSKFGPANQQYTFLVSNVVGTIGYCDPLYVETGLLTKESDVYSFGVVLFEVLCGRLSIGNGNNKCRPLTGLVRQYYEEDKVNEIIHAGLKDEIIPLSLQKFASIAYQCLRRDLKERPPMFEVVSNLERALQYQVGVLGHPINDDEYDSSDDDIEIRITRGQWPQGMHKNQDEDVPRVTPIHMNQAEDVGVPNHPIQDNENPSMDGAGTPSFNHTRNTGYGYGGLAAGMHMPVSRYKGPFTSSQWMELEHQALIYKYFVANVPVPSHLLNPLRKSLNTSLFPGSSYLTSHAPNSLVQDEDVLRASPPSKETKNHAGKDATHA